MADKTIDVRLRGLFDASDIQAKLGGVQKALSNLKVPPQLAQSANKSLNEVQALVQSIQKRLMDGFKTKGDVTGLEKDIKRYEKAYADLGKTITQISQLNGQDLILFDKDQAARLRELRLEIEKITQGHSADVTTWAQNLAKSMRDLRDSTEQKVAPVGLTKAADILDNIAKSGQVSREEVAKLQAQLEKTKAQSERALGGKDPNGRIKQFETLLEELLKINKVIEEADSSTQALNDEMQQISNKQLEKVQDTLQSLLATYTSVGDETSNFGRNLVDAARSAQEANTELENLSNQVKTFFSLTNGIQIFKRAINSAVSTIKELDAAMTETAVVSDETVGSMWSHVAEYTDAANKLGSSISDVIRAQTLYVQQGLDLDTSMKIAIQTMKMARVAGIEAADATDYMTSAMRGFNMELNEATATRINDVYSELAKVTAADTDEIAIAMSKTASIASSANMEFEKTAAFLAQIIETTREAPETAGTAMKTVIARFSEVKELYTSGQLTGTDEEGSIIDVNKISKAMRTVGIDMNKFFRGELGLDEIFTELASKWDGLEEVQKRYIATMAAGSRQQSRFIAMMSDYNRTLELQEAAYNSAGSGEEQFNKTLDSLDTKLNQLRVAWDEFTTGLVNSDLFKALIDFVTNLLTKFNDLTTGFSKIGTTLKKAFGLAGVLAIGKILVKNLLPALSIKEQVKQGVIEGYKAANSDPESKNSIRSLFQTSINDAAQAYNSTNDANAKANASPGILGYVHTVSKHGANSLQAKRAERFLGSGENNNNYDYNLTSKIRNDNNVSKQDKALHKLDGTVQSMSQTFFTFGKTLENIGFTGLGQSIQTISRKVSDFSSNFVQNLKDIKTQAKDTFNNVKKWWGGLDSSAQSAIKYAGAYAAVLAAIVVTFKIAISAQDKWDHMVRNSFDKLIEAIDATKTGVDDLSTSITNFDTIQSKIDNLTVGTTEWYEALAENNDQVSNLVSKYSELAEQVEVDANGVMRLNSENLLATNLAQEQIRLNRLNTLSLIKVGLSNEEAVNTGLRPGQISNYADSLLSVAGAMGRTTTADEDSTLLLNQDEAHQLLEAVISIPNLYKQDASIIGNTLNELNKKNGWEMDAASVDSFARALSREVDTRDKNTLEFFEASAQAAQTNASFDAYMRNRARDWNINPNNDAHINDIIETVASSKFLTQISADLVENERDKDEDAFNTRVERWAKALYGSTASYKNGEVTYQIMENGEMVTKTLESKEVEAYYAKERGADLLKLVAEGAASWDNDILNAFFGGKGLTGDMLEKYELGNDYSGFIESLTQQQQEAFRQLYGEDSEFNAAIDEFLTNQKLLLDAAADDLVTYSNTGEWRQAVYQLSATVQANIGEMYHQIGTSSMTQVETGVLKYLDSSDLSDDAETKFYEAFSEIDWTDSRALDNFKDTLIDAGIDTTTEEFKELFNVLDEINSSHALLNYNAQLEKSKQLYELLDKVSSNSNARFDNETLNSLIGAGLTREQFVFTGTDYQYIGTTETLIDAIKSNTAAIMADTQATLESIVNRGEFIDNWVNEDDSNYKTERENLINEILSGNEQGLTTSQKQSAQELGHEIGIGLNGEWGLQEWNELSVYFRENYGKNGVTYLGAKTDLEDLPNQMQEASLFNSTGQEILDANATDELKDRVLDAKLAVAGLTKEVELESKAAKNAGQDWYASDRQLKALTIDSIKAGENFDNLTKTIKDNADALASGSGTSYEKALNDVTIAAQEAFDDSITRDFVEDNLDLFQDFSNGVEGAEQKIRYAMGRQLYNDIAGNLFETEEQVNDFIKALDGATFNINGDADITDILTNMNIAEDKVAEVKAFCESLGYTLDWEIAGWRLSDQLDEYQSRLMLPVYKAVVRNTAKAATTRNSVNNGGRSSGGGGGGGSKGWDNNFDRLYNKLEDITAKQRERDKLEKAYERMVNQFERNRNVLQKGSYIAQEIENQKQQIANLKTEITLQEQLLEGRRQEMKAFQERSKALEKYAWYDESTGEVQINWSLINTIKDADKGQQVEDYVQELERIRDDIQQAEDDIEDLGDSVTEIRNQIEDFYYDQLKTATDFENTVRDYIVKARQKEIDALDQLNQAYADEQQEILDSISRVIDEQRRARALQEAEKALRDKQARLAMLQRDTTGANQAEILALQREIEEDTQSYQDQLVDQAMEQMQQDAQDAQAAREHQIEIMQSQLDIYAESLEIWDQVYDLINDATNSDGSIKEDSELIEMMKFVENVLNMSNLGQQDWWHEMSESIANGLTAIDYVTKNDIKDLIEDIDKIQGSVVSALLIDLNAAIASLGGSGGGGNGPGGWLTGPPEGTTPHYTATQLDLLAQNSNLNNVTAANDLVAHGNNPPPSTPAADKYYAIAYDLNDRFQKQSGTYTTVNGLRSWMFNSRYPKYRVYKNDKFVNLMSGPGSVTWQEYVNYLKGRGFKRGGLAKFTGPAWLDGTPSKPEIVLNPKDTENFLMLKDVLADLVSYNNGNSTISGDNYFDVHINVENIDSDYSVEQMANKVRNMIVEDAQYRNVQSLNFIR